MGISEGDLADLGRYQTSDRYSELEKLVLDLTVAMSSTPAEVPEEMRSALLQHLTSGQLTEIAATIAEEIAKRAGERRNWVGTACEEVNG